MPRYNKSRDKYTIVIPQFDATEEHQRRIHVMSVVENVKPAEIKRRCIDHRFASRDYDSLFLALSSSERTSTPDEPNEVA